MRILKLTYWFFILMASCAIPRNGLIADYSFKGNASDRRQNNNDGEVHGATLVSGHNGEKASVYHFNGIDQFIEIAHSESLNFDKLKHFTISLWVLIDGEQNNKEAPLNDILRKWKGNTQGYPFAIVYYNNTAADTLANSFSFVRYDGSICRNTPAIISRKYKTGKYNHLVCIREGNKMKMVLNGELVGEITDTTRPASSCGSFNNSEITIGTRGNKVRYFTGAIDDLRIYKRALSKKEILKLYKR